MISYEKSLTVQGPKKQWNTFLVHQWQFKEKHFLLVNLTTAEDLLSLFLVLDCSQNYVATEDTVWMIKQYDRLCQIKRAYIEDLTKKASGLYRCTLWAHKKETLITNFPRELFARLMFADSAFPPVRPSAHIPSLRWTHSVAVQSSALEGACHLLYSSLNIYRCLGRSLKWQAEIVTKKAKRHRCGLRLPKTMLHGTRRSSARGDRPLQKTPTAKCLLWKPWRHLR